MDSSGKSLVPIDVFDAYCLCRHTWKPGISGYCAFCEESEEGNVNFLDELLEASVVGTYMAHTVAIIGNCDLTSFSNKCLLFDELIVIRRLTVQD